MCTGLLFKTHFTIEHHGSASFHGLYNQPLQEIDPIYLSQFQILENNADPVIGNQGTSVSFEHSKGQYFTLESSPATAGYIFCDSPSITSGLSNRSPFSPQVSPSCISDPHHSSDNTYGSPVSGSSVADNGNELKHFLKEVEVLLLGSESDTVNSCSNCLNSGIPQATSMSRWDWNQLVRLDLSQMLLCCAEAVSRNDVSTAFNLMEVLGKMVSISGEPIQRVGTYMLEGLRAKLEHSGTVIYRSLKKCEEPTNSELMSYMSIIYQIGPYWKFAYMSANVVIGEVMANEPRIHIIDFQIAQGSQWMLLMQALANRPGGPPLVRITGVDDSQSIHARGGGLHIVGQKLSQYAESCKVPFEFHAAPMSGCEVELENLSIRPGEALAVNFPYVLHHMPDESVSTQNHRDRLLRLVKSLSPKVVTIVEQESNTNTSPFLSRFKETLEYYTAMFESIDAGSHHVALPRDDKQRIRTEENCVARDIVNMIACEDAERVERHELLGKWRSRLSMAGFAPYPLSSSVTHVVKDLLKDYNENFRLEKRDGALYLHWKNRSMATSSAWR
ncbi:scarecrow-like protein 13 isoform X2 [Corylus avellana]|uniref:scarecrow-like protein 13 isoform X2 n=1 Tax=Corylus avellana TaxID=13451 RepID=UPI00286B1364|nr:scarecrow-like protein 13 isoform X2 [Corylus avellana]